MTAPASREAPEHLTHAPVRDFDLYRTSAADGDFQAAWHRSYQCADAPGIFWTTANGGHWVATRGDDFKHFVGTPDLYSSVVNVIPRERNFGFPLIPINLDPPDHTRYRALFTAAFSPKAIMPLGDSARAMTIELIEGFRGNGRCEFMTEFAYRLPIGIFLSMVGIADSERGKLLAIVEQIVRPDNPDSSEAFTALAGFAMETIAARRADPGDDLLSTLTRAAVDGKPVTDQELAGMLLLLLLGGLDTVAATLGYVMRHLARDPAARDGLRRRVNEQPDTLPAAVEELFRRFPVSTLVREVTRDHAYKGMAFRAGDLVCCYTGAHGLDGDEFTDRLTTDFARKVAYHGGFGNGPHRCLGSMLARVEIRVFLEEWLTRIPDFAIAEGAELRTRPGLVVALASLPLTWPLA